MDKQPRDEQEVKNYIKNLTCTKSRHILQTVMLLLLSQWFVLDMLYNLVLSKVIRFVIML